MGSVQEHLSMGMLGHDIRNPLGTITMCSELLVRSGQIDRKSVEPIVNSANRIQGIVELIVDFSRAQSGGVMPIDPKPSDLKPVFESVISETQIRHPSSTFELDVQGNSEGVWDDARLAQLLSNLLENAVSYGAPGLPIAISLLGGEGPDVTFRVRNYGKVIPASDRDRIFEPRSRGSLVDQQKAPSGMGLGLYICKEIMRAHNGTLSLRSSEQEGTSFVARLPRLQPELQTAPPDKLD